MKEIKQETKVQKIFLLGKNLRVSQENSMVSLAFQVGDEEMVINFSPNHLGNLKKIIRRLRRIEMKNAKAIVRKEGDYIIPVNF
jgi:chlorite dismutase